PGAPGRAAPRPGFRAPPRGTQRDLRRHRRPPQPRGYCRRPDRRVSGAVPRDPRDARRRGGTSMTEAFIVDGVRTPIGRYAGALSTVRPDDLAAHALRSLLRRHPSVPAAAVDDVVLGCANQAGEDNRNVARM